MADKHGLGRGLSSLIPNKNGKKDTAKDLSSAKASQQATEKKPIASQTVYTKAPQIGDMPLRPARDKVQPQKDATEQSVAVIGVPIADLVPNAQQPRMYFDEKKLSELARSIKEHGVLQPLVVLKKDNGYEIIAGERRLRAAERAGLSKVPVIVRGEMKEQKKLELAIIENVQRHDLNVIEEAKSYKKLADEFDLSQDEIAKRTGKSRSAIANRMRLLHLPVEIQRAIIEGKITEGHAKVILSIEQSEKQRALFDAIMRGGLSVREAERVLKKTSHVVGGQRENARGEKNPQERILEEQLAAYFGTKVHVSSRGKDGGEIKITYFSQEELRTILEKLKF